MAVAHLATHLRAVGRRCLEAAEDPPASRSTRDPTCSHAACMQTERAASDKRSRDKRTPTRSLHTLER